MEYSFIAALSLREQYIKEFVKMIADKAIMDMDASPEEGRQESPDSVDTQIRKLNGADYSISGKLSLKSPVRKAFAAIMIEEALKGANYSAIAGSKSEAASVAVEIKGAK